MSTTLEAVTARMSARAAQMSTPTLCEALGMLTTARRRTPEEHLTRSVLIGVLCERHPEAGRAADDWAGDESRAYNLDEHDAVIISAARAAAGNGR